MLGPYASYKGNASWHPGFEFVGIFDRYGVKPKGVIHVGMWAFEEHECYTQLFGTNVIGIEASPEIYTTMSKPAADKYGYKAYNFPAFSKDNAVMDFYINSSSSSLFKEGRANLPSIKMTTKTLDTLIEEEKIDMETIDFLNIDAEGTELEILKGIDKNLCHINFVDLETSVGDRYNSGVCLKTIRSYLKERHYDLVEISSSFFNQGWGDAFFIHEKFNKKPSIINIYNYPGQFIYNSDLEKII